MTPPLCLPTYFPPIPPPYPPSLYPCSSSLFLIWHLPSPLAPRSFPLFLHICPSVLFLFFFILFFYFLLFCLIFFQFLVLFYYFPSHLALSLYSLLPSLFFIPSDSYYFSFFLLILFRSSFPTPFFPHSLHHCLQLLPSLFELSSFFSSSFSPSLLRCPSPFSHHSLSHVSSSLFIPPYPPLIHPLLIFLFFFLFSFHLFLLFLFLSLSSTFPVPFSLFFSSFFLPPSFFLFIHFFYIFFLFFLFFLLSLSVFGSFSFISSSLLHSPPSLFSFFPPVFSHISSIFFSYSFPSRLPVLSLLPLLLPSFFLQPPFLFLSPLFLLPSCSSFLSFFFNSFLLFIHFFHILFYITISVRDGSRTSPW